jgi:hypothetical protein
MPIEHDAIREEPSGAWARITSFEGSADDVQQALRLVLEHVLPVTRTLPGWKGSIGLASPDRRRGLTLSIWESEETMQRSTTDAMRFKDMTPKGVSISNVDRLEVVFEESPEQEP